MPGLLALTLCLAFAGSSYAAGPGTTTVCLRFTTTRSSVESAIGQETIIRAHLKKLNSTLYAYSGTQLYTPAGWNPQVCSGTGLMEGNVLVIKAKVTQNSTNGVFHESGIAMTSLNFSNPKEVKGSFALIGTEAAPSRHITESFWTDGAVAVVSCP